MSQLATASASDATALWRSTKVLLLTRTEDNVWRACVAVTNLTCHEECHGQCYGEAGGQCCHDECAGGCFGAGKERCWVSNSALFSS